MSDDEIMPPPLDLLTARVREALTKIAGVELAEHEPGTQLAASAHDDHDAFGMKHHIRLDPEVRFPISDYYVAEASRLIFHMLRELTDRKVRPEHTRPMWFASLANIGYIPFQAQGYPLAITTEVDSEHFGTLGIFVAVDYDRL